MSAPFQWIDDIGEIYAADGELDAEDIFEEIAERAEKIFIQNPDMDPRDAFVASATLSSYTYAASGRWSEVIEQIDNEEENTNDEN